MEGTVVRLLVAAGISIALVGAWRLVNALILWHSRKNAGRLAHFAQGTPGVVFFTAPDCVTCKAAQKPALRALSERLGGKLQVIEVDALDNSKLAREWSVFSVPTTFVLDRGGTPRQVNHGFVSTEKLLSQIASLG